ncbi:hypothetical protein Vretimale_2497 [Volvox reticuliferus]|uniref:Uncharacterized protein n=1 Tax=Volvox reticuliferus TaxID=1737510 RepID=A0A8J4C575_9CHLO|nr:hypothetical protein Vretifemale_4854 [Volvox reticuliferus]GIL96823.1 hypothetical protein Vretimale_2497 [Volvox reticuliferus]
MDGQPCPTSNAQQLRVVKQLLWDVISLHLYPAERDEIRRTLGNSLLDDNETLFAEAGALADILGDVQLNTSALLARHQLCSNPQRSMVETEIRLLVDRLHASAAVSPFGSTVVKERDPESLLPRQGKRDKAVLEYVTTVAQIVETGGRPPSAGLPPRPPSTAVSSSSRPGTSSRPPTALSASASASISLPSPLSRPGTASPTIPGSRPSTASSAASSTATRYTDAPSVVAGVADKLNVSSIDAVRETLRTALLDERAALLEDVEYLQGLLEAEADLQVRAAAPPPSLAELKDYSSRLAAVVANEEARVEHEVRVSAMFAAAERQQNKPGRLRGMVDASRRPTSGGGSPGPVLKTASPPETAPASVHPPVRRTSASGGTQTLVLHGGGDETTLQQHRLPFEPSTAPAAAMATSADAGSGSLAAASTSSRATPLAAVRRPGSGGSSSRSSAASVVALAGIAPVGGLRSVAPLPPTRLSPPACANGSPAAVGNTNASPSAAAADSDGLGSSPVGPSSRLLHSPSPGRLRPAAATAMPHAQVHNETPHSQQISPAQPYPHHDKSPPLLTPPNLAHGMAASSCTARGLSPSPAKAGTGGLSVAPATMSNVGTVNMVAQPGLRPVRPRSDSVGRSATGGATKTPAGAPASLSVNGSANSATRAGNRVSSTTVGGDAPAGKAVPSGSPGSTVIARLSAAGGAGTESNGMAVQPRALLGNKHSLVEVLDEEVDKVKGGVAAILERYNIRASTPSAPAVAATTAAAAVVAPPPANSRGGS